MSEIFGSNSYSLEEGSVLGDFLFSKVPPFKQLEEWKLSFLVGSAREVNSWFRCLRAVYVLLTAKLDYAKGFACRLQKYTESRNENNSV